MAECKPDYFDISESTVDFFYWLVVFAERYNPYHSYVSICICAFGVTTNLINIVVLTRPRMRTVVNVLLTAIAICNTATMLSDSMRISIGLALDPKECHSEQYPLYRLYWILFHSSLTIWLHTTSLWLAVLLAYIRLMVIGSFTAAQHLLNVRMLFKMISGLGAGLLLLVTPLMLVTSVEEIHIEQDCPSSANTSIVYQTMPSSIALKHNCLLLRLSLWIVGLLFKMLPCLLLAGLICALMRTFQKATLRHSRLIILRTGATFSSVPHGQGRGSNILPGLRANTRTTELNHISYTGRTTVILLAILLIFLFTEIPQAVTAMCSAVHPAFFYVLVYPRLGNLLDLLALINSCVNFILYCSMSSEFRATFMQLFLPCLLPQLRDFNHNECSTRQRATGNEESVNLDNGNVDHVECTEEETQL